MKKKLASLLAVCMASTMLLAGCGGGNNGANSAEGGDTGAKTELVMATGGETGTYYAVGNVMATALNPLLKNSNLKVVVSGGSQDDIIRIEDGEAQLGTVQNDVMSYAMNGTDTFADLGACTNFRAVAGLYDETCQIITTDMSIKTVEDLKGKTVMNGTDTFADLGACTNFRAVAGLYDETCQIITTDMSIKTVEDLKGKTVSVGDAGSGVEFNAKQILDVYGLSFDDIKAVNSGFTDSASSLKDGKIDAAFVTAGAPTTAVTDLATTNKISVVAIDSEHADKLIAEHPFYTKAVIPGGTYKGVDADTETVSVRATLIASADLSEDVVYELTKALFENQESMAGSHDKFKELSLETAMNGIDVEFHPGAIKYYEEKGIQS